VTLLRACVVTTLFLAFAAGSAAGAPPPLSKTFAAPEHGITFRYPEGFESGRYKDAGSLPPGWTQIAVLVDRAQLAAAPANAIPRGKVPTIDIIETSGLPARAQIAAVQSGQGAQYMRTFGKTIAYKLPGAFGPFGDQALFYLVPVDSERAMMVVAPRDRALEEAIDAMLATLVVKPK
jgi:hypothetical protein